MNINFCSMSKKIIALGLAVAAASLTACSEKKAGNHVPPEQQTSVAETSASTPQYQDPPRVIREAITDADIELIEKWSGKPLTPYRKKNIKRNGVLVLEDLKVADQNGDGWIDMVDVLIFGSGGGG